MIENLQIHVLGPFETHASDGEAIDFSHRKGRALLAYLAVEGQRPQSREHLATLLWARTGDDRARHNLRQALSKIRNLCPDLVNSASDRILLDPSTCELDVVTFDRLSGSDNEADMQQALELYRGDLLEGYQSSEAAYQDWLVVARGRMRKQACELAGRLAKLLSSESRDQQAIDVLNRLLRIDQANESAHRQLMQLHARAGRRSEALRQYQECVAALRRELDTGPGAETRQLLAELQHTFVARFVDHDGFHAARLPRYSRRARVFAGAPPSA